MDVLYKISRIVWACLIGRSEASPHNSIYYTMLTAIKEPLIRNDKTLT